MLTRTVWMAGWLAGTLAAQAVIATKAGLLAYGEGEIYMDERRVQVSTAHPVVMREKGVLRTGTGRVEVLLGPCAVMWMDERSAFRMAANRLTDARIELLAGSSMVEEGEAVKGNRLTVKLGTAAASVDRRGVYRFDVEASRVGVVVGRTTVEWADQSFAIVAGRMMSFETASGLQKLERRSADPFEQWSKGRAVVWVKGDRAGVRVMQQEDGTATAAAARMADSTTHPRNADARLENAGRATTSIPIRGVCGWTGW